jgi:hypothetical protein
MRRLWRIARPTPNPTAHLPEGSPGQSMVEFALSLMLILYLIMGIVDFGRAIVLYNAVANTAREAARYATVSSRTSTEILAYGAQQAGFSGISLTVVQRGTAGNPDQPAIVQAAATFSPITPLIANVCCGGGPLALSARSAMFVEQ